MNKKILFLILLLTAITSTDTIFAAVPGTAKTGFDKMVDNIGRMIFSVATSIVVIGWLIAGILWLTSAGNPEKTGVAKKATIAAVIGTVIIILASGAVGIYGVIQQALLQGI